MTKVVEGLLSTTIIRELKGIQSASVLEKKNGEAYIQTEGVNFDIINELGFINMESIASNDIQAIARKFGVHLFLIIDLSW